MRLTSQLLKSISRVLQKLLKYFDDTSISKCFVFKAAEFFPLILILDLNDSKFTIAASCSYIAIYYIAITFQKFLNTPKFNKQGESKQTGVRGSGFQNIC